MARLMDRRVAQVAALGAALLLALPGCSSKPSGSGFSYTVRSGDTLYGLGRRFGIDHKVLKRVNDVGNTRRLQVGTRLWIPDTGTRAYKRAASKAGTSQRFREARSLALRDARRNGKLKFRWPVKGRLSSRFGKRKGRPHEGIDIAASKGTLVRAAESGKVIHSGRLGAYGRTVIVKHSGNYRTVYAHASKTLVSKGKFVDRGDKIAKVGSTGRSSGPHLHFEIRRREAPVDPMLYLD